MSSATATAPPPLSYASLNLIFRIATAITLWERVGGTLDKSHTVVWSDAVQSIQEAKELWPSSSKTESKARAFAETYLDEIVCILLGQYPGKIGPFERNCVQESLQAAVDLILLDLKFIVMMKSQKLQEGGDTMSFSFLKTLGEMFNEKKAFYTGRRGNWVTVSNTNSGLPLFRLALIKRFVDAGGFLFLKEYYCADTSSLDIDTMTSLVQVLLGVSSAFVSSGEDISSTAALLEDSLNIATAVTTSLQSWTSEDLQSISSPAAVSALINHLSSFFDIVADVGYRKKAHEFYAFWRSFCTKLLAEEDARWQGVALSQASSDLLRASARYRPPPSSCIVLGAGAEECNGEYDYKGPLTPDGYVPLGQEPSFHRTTESGKVLRLRAQQKLWFLSAVPSDKENPGTTNSRDIDFYQNKTQTQEANYPPAEGWSTCKPAGIDPPPTSQPGPRLLCPPGQECTTPEQEMARWILNSHLIEDAVNRGTVVAPSPSVVRLAEFCGKVQTTFPPESGDLEEIGTLVAKWKEFLAIKAAEEKAAAERAAAEELADIRLDEYSFTDHSKSGLESYEALTNLGRTGYMDGVLQTLFLFEPFCQLMLSQIDQTKIQGADDVNAQLLFSFCQLFGHLHSTQQKVNDANDDPAKRFVDSCGKALKLEYAIRQPNDATEFVRKLLHCIGKAIKSDEDNETTAEAFQNLVCLAILKQKVCRACCDIIERREEIYTIACQTRGKTSLEECLESMTSEEVMEGNNKVFCEQCELPTETSLKTVFDGTRLPGLLCLELKRFDLDFATFETVKLNHRVSFPKKLEMRKYCASGGTRIYYCLKSVVIHVGIAQGGYYYSLIRIGTSGTKDERWLKFNSGDVEWFDFGNIEEEAFGKGEASHGCNALMLFYEKARAE